MPEYQFANQDGSIVTENYDRNNYLSDKQVLNKLKEAFQLFPYKAEINQVNNFDDVFHVTYPMGDGFGDIYICGKGTTPGGRQGLTDEQRIQPKAKYLNYVYEKQIEGKKGIFLGVYSRGEQTIFCTWKVTQSKASSPETPISKQIKIDSISKAIQEGFVQHDKGRGEYACAFKPEFLYFYLRNSDWLHTGVISELAEHTAPESEDNKKEEIGNLVFCTGFESKHPCNRILFGAPGTGKSYSLNNDRIDLLGDNNESDYERVTFHPDYSYANFVGTYKPVTNDNNDCYSIDSGEKEILWILQDKNKSAQCKYDELKDSSSIHKSVVPILVSFCNGKEFKTDGDYNTQKNHGVELRKYLQLKTLKQKASEISYEYVPGPFMRMYVKALKNAQNAANGTEDARPFLLIIEEINRANVATVFGDVFQLLDRKNNVSEYPIQASEDIKKYLAKELGGDPKDYAKIRIPDNLFIWATMNSADQGVFPMDTAFKRRWDFTYLGIDEKAGEIAQQCVYLNKGAKIYWNGLRMAINDYLAKIGVNEDKQLGPYFLKKDVISDSKKFCEVFKHKIIMYLFEDAAKQKRASVFSGFEKENLRYSKICEAFDERGIEIFNKEIQDKCTKYDPAEYTSTNEEES